MLNHKIIKTLLLSFILLFMLFSCTKEPTEKLPSLIPLEAPVVTYQDGEFTWNEVANAHGYAVFINGEQVIRTALLSYLHSDVETFEFYVVAKADSDDTTYTDSPKSNVIRIENVRPVSKIDVVKKLILDDDYTNHEVCFMGQVIGFDFERNVYVADETGAIMIEKNSYSLKVGDVVKVIGKGQGPTELYEVMVQAYIKKSGLKIEKVDTEISPLAKYILEYSNINSDQIWHGNAGIQVWFSNLVSFSGYIECGDTLNDFWITDYDKNVKIKIDHRSTLIGKSLDPAINQLLKYDRKYVTITGIINNFYQYYSIITIGIPGEIIYLTLD